MNHGDMFARPRKEMSLVVIHNISTIITEISSFQSPCKSLCIQESITPIEMSLVPIQPPLRTLESLLLLMNKYDNKMKILLDTPSPLHSLNKDTINHNMYGIKKKGEAGSQDFDMSYIC